MAQNKFFYLDKPGLSQYDTLIKQYISAEAYCKVLYGTTSEWNSQATLVSQLDRIYVYTDYYTDSSGNPVPGIKVGDGTAYLIDRPFVTKILDEHLADQICHITAAERLSWNNKVTCFVDPNNATRLVFSKD